MKLLDVPRDRRWWWWGPALVVALGLALWINVPLGSQIASPHALARVAQLPAFSGFRAGQRVLVLSPHPDDETLCCAGAIQQAKAAGAEVYVLWATSGDGFEFDAALEYRKLRPKGQAMVNLGLKRVAEAQAAARVLGISPDHQRFLGYPDGGLLHLFLENYGEAYTSPYTGKSAVYIREAVSPGSAFTGFDLERDMSGVIADVRPDLVLAPAPSDAHPDHQAVSYLAVRIMAKRGEENRLRYWVVHGGLEWPLPKGEHPGLALTLPPRAPNLAWQRVSLTPGQVQVKTRAVDTYRSQTRILGRFMDAFLRRNELLSTTPLPARLNLAPISR